MPDKTTLDSAIEVLDKLRTSDLVVAKFKKKDGTVRIMRCTLNFEKIPDKDKPKNINLPKILKLINNSKIVHVYDLEKKAWRCIPIDRVEWLDIDEIRYRIKL